MIPAAEPVLAEAKMAEGGVTQTAESAGTAAEGQSAPFSENAVQILAEGVLPSVSKTDTLSIGESDPGSQRLSKKYAALDLDESRFDGWLVSLADSGDICLVRDLKAVARLEQSHAVTAVEPNYELILADETESFEMIPAEETEEDGAGTETEIIDGWAYEAMKTDYARERGLTGSGIRIAVLDSGIDPEDPDLEQAIIAEGYNVFTGTADVTDDVGHGTIVAAMIAGDADDTGVTGIAPGAEILPVKMTASGKTTHLSDMVRAVNYAMEAGADIINMSFAYRADNMTSDPDLENHTVAGQLMEAAAEQGIVLVAAAGNVSSSYPAGTVVHPAAFEPVIGVGSVDQNKAAYSGTLHTEAVYVCAPGRYVYFKGTSRSGTSFAAPCVSAAAALLLQQEPELSWADVMARIRTRAEDLGDPGYDVNYGYGFVRADRLLHREHQFETVILKEPGCEEEGRSAGICAFCGEQGEETAIPALGHEYTVSSIKKATLSADGLITRTCSRCGGTITERVARPADFSLRYTVATYSGSLRRPPLTVTDAGGQTIAPEFYQVTRPEQPVDVGTYTVTVAMKSPYSGKKKLTYIIRPLPAEIRKLTAGSGRIRVVWKKQDIQTTGYQIQIARKADFSLEKQTFTVRNPQQTAKTITGLKKNRTYYVRVRTFLKTPERNYYSMWKETGTVKTLQ